MSNDAHVPLYRSRFVAVGYDLFNRLLWFPTGSDRLRHEFVDSLGLRPGGRVLEIGCGTGLVTRHLVGSGASVTSVERSATMLAAARDRAPGATFLLADAIDDPPAGGPFDHVVLAFVLHELEPDDRVGLLATAQASLAAGGSVDVLEWSRPANPLLAAGWSATVQTVEPRVAWDVLDDGVDVALARAGLVIAADRTAAGGRARLIRALIAGARSVTS